MEEQIVKQINDDLSKNPSCECYHIKKYFGDKPFEEYSIIRMMEFLQNGFIAPGIKDSELVQLLLYRVETTYKNYENKEELIESLYSMLNHYINIENNG